MYAELTRDHQPSATTEVAVELRRQEAMLDARRAEPPRPGDTFVCRRTADFPVEWAVIENDNDRVCVVPLDVHPFVGSRDLALTDSTPGVTGVLRFDLDAWVDTEHLEPELRSGCLTSHDLEAVRQKRQALADETFEASLVEEEVDSDPEYVLWREETLEPALAALHRDVATERKPKKIIGGRNWWPMAVAALLMMTVALPLWRKTEQLSRQLVDEQTRFVQIDEERRTLADQLAGSEREVNRLESVVEETRESAERILAEQKERLDNLAGRAFERVVLNVPSFVLGRDARRRASRGLPEVIDPGEAARFTLSLEVTDPDPYFHYRLHVVQDGGEVWSTDGLNKVNGKWLRLDFPKDVFGSGEYELLIEGLGSRGATRLDERYRIQLK